MTADLAIEAARHAHAHASGNPSAYPSLSAWVWASARAKNAGAVLDHGEFVRAYEAELVRLRGAP